MSDSLDFQVHAHEAARAARHNGLVDPLADLDKVEVDMILAREFAGRRRRERRAPRLATIAAYSAALLVLLGWIIDRTFASAAACGATVAQAQAVNPTNASFPGDR